jgi:Helix-turn-helix domain
MRMRKTRAPTTDEIESLLTTEKVAALFNVCETTVRRWVKARKFPPPFYPTPGSPPRWLPRVIEGFINKRRVARRAPAKLRGAVAKRDGTGGQ